MPPQEDPLAALRFLGEVGAVRNVNVLRMTSQWEEKLKLLDEPRTPPRSDAGSISEPAPEIDESQTSFPSDDIVGPQLTVELEETMTTPDTRDDVTTPEPAPTMDEYETIVPDVDVTAPQLTAEFDAEPDVTVNKGEDEPNGDLPFLVQDENSDASSCDDNTDIQSNSEMDASAIQTPIDDIIVLQDAPEMDAEPNVAMATEGEDEPNDDLPFLGQDENSDTSSRDDITDIQSNSGMETTDTQTLGGEVTTQQIAPGMMADATETVAEEEQNDDLLSSVENDSSEASFCDDVTNPTPDHEMQAEPSITATVEEEEANDDPPCLVQDDSSVASSCDDVTKPTFNHAMDDNDTQTSDDEVTVPQNVPEMAPLEPAITEGEDKPSDDLPFLVQDENSDASSCDDITDIQSNSEMGDTDIQTPSDEVAFPENVPEMHAEPDVSTTVEDETNGDLSECEDEPEMSETQLPQKDCPKTSAVTEPLESAQLTNGFTCMNKEASDKKDNFLIGLIKKALQLLWQRECMDTEEPDMDIYITSTRHVEQGSPKDRRLSKIPFANIAPVIAIICLLPFLCVLLLQT